MNFLNLISNVQSWQDFRDALDPQPKKVKGDAFEYLTKYALQLIPRYKAKLKKVWLSNELPPSKRKHFRQPTRDIGIDLYAETYDGEYWAIQCKYHSKHPLNFRISDHYSVGNCTLFMAPWRSPACLTLGVNKKNDINYLFFRFLISSEKPEASNPVGRATMPTPRIATIDPRIFPTVVTG